MRPSCAVASLATPSLHLFRHLLPPMFDTEREALEAGSVWWEAELVSWRSPLAKSCWIFPPRG